MHGLPMIVLLAVAETPRLFEQTAGQWSVWVESSIVESTWQHKRRALTSRQVVTRRGPQGQSVLFEGDSTGQWLVAMNEHGVVLVYGVGLANLFFPGKKEAVTFEIQGHPGWISSNMSQVFFLGDTVLYGDAMQGVGIGIIEIDLEKQRVRSERVFDKSKAYVRQTIDQTPRPIRLGQRIFFKGPTPSDGGASPRQETRVLDLAKGAVLALNDVPAALLTANREALQPFIDQAAP